jgi:ribosomal protein S7
MLSRSTASAIRASCKATSRVASRSVIRFNSSNSSSKPFYKTYTEFLKTHNKLNENGEFINESSNFKDYENSELAKHISSANLEKERLINEKLKALAELNNISYDELKKSFDLKVTEKENLILNENNQILNKIESFTSKLSLLSINNKQNLINDLLDGLLPFQSNLNESKAFKFIYDLDPNFAKAFGNIIRITPTEESVNLMIDAFKSGPISKISDDQYNELKNLLDSKIVIENNIEETENVENIENIENVDIDGLTVVETIFSNLNNYENINNSPLLKLIESIDSKFADLLKSYETIDPSNDDELKIKYEEILNYCSNEESPIFKAFGDYNSPHFTKLKEVLDQPLPIDLAELYEIFEFYPDYFQSDLFKTINEIDSKFGTLLNELETLPEGPELDAKNNEIDEYLLNKESPIYIAMNDTNSEAYNTLRNILDVEWNKMENTVTTDKLIEFIINNGLESDCFKLINKIDPSFAEFINKLYNERDEENAMKIYVDLQEYLNQENNILAILNDKESLNYKLLADYVFAKSEEIEEDTNTENVIEEIKEDSNISVVESNELELLAKEDQSKLSSQIIEINKGYDLTIDILNEIEEELKNNTFIPVSRKVSQKLDKLLGFQPSTEQVVASENLKNKSLPKQADEVLELAVNIIMKDGKKEIARKHLNRTLYLLFLETRSNPVEKLKEALDIVAPIVVTKTVKTGFAKNFTVPVPLTQRQRDRMALMWILKSCDSKASNDFSVRLCDEIMHVLGGKSALMDKRVLNHKMAIANRSYLTI